MELESEKGIIGIKLTQSNAYGYYNGEFLVTDEEPEDPFNEEEEN